MRCERCQGARFVAGSIIVNCGSPLAEETKLMVPCPDCTGGIAHCCEGLREQPEKDDA